MSDPDSWPIIQLLISLIFLAVCAMYSGAVAEESTQKEILESGVGLSYKTTASVLLWLPFAVWSMISLNAISHSLAILTQTPNTIYSAPNAWYYAVFAATYVAVLLVAVMLFVLLPFSWGRARSEVCEQRMRFMKPFCAMFLPLAKLATYPARRILAARGIASEVGSVTEEDVLEIMDTAEENEFIDENQKEMIGNIFDLDEVSAADIMTHRTEVEAISVTAVADDIINAAVEFGYSRIPVYEGSLDNIIGIAYVKDFLPYVGKGTRGMDLKKIMRPTLFVPESCRARELLFEFKQKKIQLAVVVDEYGGTAGIVTMEDILESIVGDIEDEYDEEESFITENADGSLTCDGYAEIEEVFEYLGFETPEDIESDTIGGLVTGLLARIPKKGENPVVEYNNIELTALDADERRIISVLVRVAPEKKL